MHLGISVVDEVYGRNGEDGPGTLCWDWPGLLRQGEETGKPASGWISAKCFGEGRWRLDPEGEEELERQEPSSKLLAGRDLLKT